MDAVKAMAVNVALKNMFSRGYFDICTINKILKLTNVVPRSEDYDLLNALHCCDFKDMPPELLQGLPVIVQRVIGSEQLVFEYKKYASANIRLAA